MSGHIRANGIAPKSVCAQLLEGRVQSIVWQADEEDGPCILRMQDGQTVRSDSGAQMIQTGECRRFLGSYQEHPKYGRQFVAATCGISPGSDRMGAIKYLSQLCDGIGEKLAKKLVDAHGPQVIKLLREQPEKIIEEELLTATTAFEAHHRLKCNASTERVEMELHGLFAGRGFGQRSIKSAIAAWGDSADAVVKTNPWRLLLEGISGAGWKRVDRLYQDLGGDPAALKRQAMAGWYALREAGHGSTWHAGNVFVAGVLSQLEAAKCRPEAALKLAVRAKMIERSRADIEKGWLADPRAAACERGIAFYLARLMHAGGPAWPMLTSPEVSEHQAEQINAAATSPVMLLTGIPGTGKTYAAAALLRMVARSEGISSLCVMAPTGKAAVRITEALRRNGVSVEATTIHRALKPTKMGYEDGYCTFAHDEYSPLPYDWIAIDEVSMCDAPLMDAVLRAVRPGANLLMIGDQHQLPPVGHGCPLRDFIASAVPRANLTEIKRNSGLITSGCQLVKEGRLPKMATKIDLPRGDNLRLVECSNGPEQLQSLHDILVALGRIPGIDIVWDVAILVSRNDAEHVGRKQMNDYLQQLLNPIQTTDPRAGQDVWRLRDKIICLKNGMYDARVYDARKAIHLVDNWHKPSGTYDGPPTTFVANGELGRMVAIDPHKADCIVRFDLPTRYVLIKAPKRIAHKDGSESAREDNFALGYAITCHKSQGSEWPVVLVMLDPGADRVASREWIYTAISRASKACFLLGSESVLKRQLGRAELPAKKTFLQQLIFEEIENGKRNGNKGACPLVRSQANLGEADHC